GDRQDAQLEPLIGFFVNTLVMRLRLRPGLSFATLLADVRRTALEAYQHQDVPFERVVKALAPHRTLNRNPLFQVSFTMLNAPLTTRAAWTTSPCSMPPSSSGSSAIGTRTPRFCRRPRFPPCSRHRSSAPRTPPRWSAPTSTSPTPP